MVKARVVAADKAAEVVKAREVAADKAADVAWDRAAVADEVWVVEVDAVWGAVAALLVPAASVSVPIAVRLFHISKVYLALR